MSAWDVLKKGGILLANPEAPNFASHMPSKKAKDLGEAYARNLSLGASK
jgi:hypothetical protein